MLYFFCTSSNIMRRKSISCQTISRKEKTFLRSSWHCYSQFRNQRSLYHQLFVISRSWSYVLKLRMLRTLVKCSFYWRLKSLFRNQVIISWTWSLLGDLKSGCCCIKSGLGFSQSLFGRKGPSHLRNNFVSTWSRGVFCVIHDTRIPGTYWTSLSFYDTFIILRWVKTWIWRFLFWFFLSWAFWDGNFYIFRYLFGIVKTRCWSLLNSMVNLGSSGHTNPIT